MLFMGLVIFLAAAATTGLIGPAAAQQSPTKTETSTLWLPPRSTRAGERIFASVITAAPSSTELFLACTTAWRSASSCAQFSGVTLTYGDSSMKIAFGSESFDCKRGAATATCAVAASSQTMLASAESASWFTAVTIVDGHDKLSSAKAKTSTSPEAAATTSGSGLCKRVSVTRPKTGGGGGGDGDCSAASGGLLGGMSLLMAGAAAGVVGALVTMFL